MHLAYSAFRDNIKLTNSNSIEQLPTTRRLKLRYRGYLAACQKYEQEIAAIQRYLPDWQPAFK